MIYQKANSLTIWGFVLILGIFLPLALTQDWFILGSLLFMYLLSLLAIQHLYDLLNWIDPIVLFTISYVIPFRYGDRALMASMING